MKQADKSVTSYFNELKNLWEDLEALRILLNCTCGAHDALKKERDVEYIIYFLKGLNDNFNHVKSQILMIEPLPDVTKLFSSILQQERQLVSPSDHTKILMARAHNSSSHAKFQSKQSRGRGKHTFKAKVLATPKFVHFIEKLDIPLILVISNMAFSQVLDSKIR